MIISVFQRICTFTLGGWLCRQKVNGPLVFFYVFIYFELEDNWFTILCWILPYNNMNQPQVHINLPPEPPPYPPPHPMPLGFHRALGQAPFAQRAASHWLSILHMVVYICQCCSLNSSYHLTKVLKHNSVKEENSYLCN